MYPPPKRPTGPPSLPRYGSAPGSFLASVVDSVINDDDFSIGSDSHLSQYFSGDSTDSTCKPPPPPPPPSEIYRPDQRISSSGGGTGGGGLQRSYGLNQLAVGDLSNANNARGSGGNAGGGGGNAAAGVSSLIRHSSSPAGFFNQHVVDNGFTVPRGIGGYNSQASSSGHGIPNGRLTSQLSFTRQDSLSQISEASDSVADLSSSDEGARNTGHAYASGSFPMSSWDNGNTIMFSTPNKRVKTMNGDMAAALSDVDSQFSLPRTSLEMAAVEKYLHIQPDSVPCKIRAKRGFATHPRSIAERERRTRISEKLRKLQELVPNMDKQTSTADMLDLAVQHIKGLQGEVQKLNKDLDRCTCGCKPTL